jgi:hypothetical protein
MADARENPVRVRPVPGGEGDGMGEGVRGMYGGRRRTGVV